MRVPMTRNRKWGTKEKPGIRTENNRLYIYIKKDEREEEILSLSVLMLMVPFALFLLFFFSVDCS